MYCFNNDYSEGAHPQIMEAITQAGFTQNAGYGQDTHTEEAKEFIKQEIQRNDADIHFLIGGTQTNMLVIRAALRPHQAVISAETGHINVHETGAIEFTGHKVLTQPSLDGKLTPDLIQKTLDWHTDEHMVQPKMVYLSNSTEIGTQYHFAELEALSHFCRQKNLYLFLDGARLGSALTSPSNDLTMADIARLTDVFYIGGTKNGALFGEALVIVNEELKSDFRYLIKQNGALLAKGFLLGIQFKELFRDQLFYKLADHANKMAARIKQTFIECHIPLFSDSETNQQFPILPNDFIDKLKKSYQFQEQQPIDSTHTVVRFVTSWATREEDVSQFIKDFVSICSQQ